MSQTILAAHRALHHLAEAVMEVFLLRGAADIYM